MSSVAFKALPSYFRGLVNPYVSLTSSFSSPRRSNLLVFQSLRAWGPSLAIWGIGAGLHIICPLGLSFTLWDFDPGVYATYFLSVTPLVKREFLTKIPIVSFFVNLTSSLTRL